MYAALLKHEARLQTRPLLAYLGIALAVFAGGMALALLRIPAVSQIGALATISACVFLALSVPAGVLMRYYTSMYGREGYLTHAIPAKHTTLYAAKFTWALAVWLIALVVAIGMGVGFFVAQTVAYGGTVADAWTSLTEALAGLGTAPTIALVGWCLIGVVIYVAQFGWIVTFGMEDRFRALGVGGPVLVWFASYLVLQVLTIVAILLIPLGVSLDLSELVFTTFASELPKAFANEDPSFIPLGWLPLLLATLPVYVVWTLRSLKKHTSLR
ncbi:MAG: hypothetical protein QM708_11130 [Propioniciclava sp.]|uniref:hypothetical protein n=1 Tax=Propioniciclava sp. TaxID=2038686 RepID=UPI0039E3A52E